MQKRCLSWRDGLCGGSGLNDHLKENITNKKELYGSWVIWPHVMYNI